ncbi:Tim44/TimA family putative adaptor protein [Azospirillum oleiclasticum]|uniref:Tim44/TimA family putative adaptor protein n=1 Tax=Azospirillum oleiclasticum TaxID=2735135 RepID=UPI0031B5F663
MFIEIVIFAMIAAFLVYRLRSVLGRRTGEERQRPNPYTPPVRPQQNGPQPNGPDNVVPLPDRVRPIDGAPADAGEPLSLAASLAQIRSADPSFDEKIFIQGASAAFTMVVEAFAKADTATLRPLLSDDVYDNFAGAIRERQNAGETLETRIDRIRDADVVEARLDGRTAFLTVKFVSDQMNVTRDRNGAVAEGDADKVVEVTDIWTFARNIRSRDPNWLLVETRVPS